MIPYCGFLVKKREFGYIKFREAVLTKSKRLFHRGQMNIPNHLPHINPKFVICRKIINSILVSPPNLSDMPIATRHSIHFMGISRLQFGILIVRRHSVG